MQKLVHIQDEFKNEDNEVWLKDQLVGYDERTGCGWSRYRKENLPGFNGVMILYKSDFQKPEKDLDLRDEEWVLQNLIDSDIRERIQEHGGVYFHIYDERPYVTNDTLGWVVFIWVGKSVEQLEDYVVKEKRKKLINSAKYGILNSVAEAKQSGIQKDEIIELLKSAVDQVYGA